MKKIKVRGDSIWGKMKKKLPHMEVCFSKLKIKSKMGKVAFVLVPLLLAGGGVATGITLLNNNKPTKIIETSTNKQNRRIYLASKDRLTIPLTVSLTKRATQGEELIEIFNLLKTDSKANTTSIRGVIPSKTKINSIEVFKEELSIDVSANFLDYEATQEVNVLESLIYTFSEYPKINEMSIYVDGLKLTKMPKTNIAIPDYLKKTFGINREHKSTVDVAGKAMFNIYYTKTYDSKSYLIPVSQYVDNKESLEVQLVNALTQKVDAAKGLSQAAVYSAINSTQANKDKSKFLLQLKPNGLKEEGVVKRELFDMVSLTMRDYDKDLEVKFTIEDDLMMVEGLINADDYEVSDLIFNQVKI